MLLIPLSQVPNQAVSFNADTALWTVHIYLGGNFMRADVAINGVPVINGFRCFAGIPLLPYSYMSAPSYGNLIFDQNADWTQFGASCNLYYLTQDEMVEFNAAMEDWA